MTADLQTSLDRFLTGMHPTVLCEVCGHRNRLERRVNLPTQFRLVCHECESVLRVTVTDADLAEAARS